jgi:hypothetical protein
MSRGKKVGHVKAQVTIKDDMIAPYYISMDENQFTVQIEGSTLPLGYYSTLEVALKRIAKYKLVENLNQSTVDLTDFLKAYDNVLNQINNRIPV